MLAREGRGPRFAIVWAAVVAAATNGPILSVFSHAWIPPAFLGQGLAAAFLGTILLSWMTLRPGSIVPVGPFYWLVWGSLGYAFRISLLRLSRSPELATFGTLAACTILFGVAVAICLKKPFAESEALDEPS